MKNAEDVKDAEVIGKRITISSASPVSSAVLVAALTIFSRSAKINESSARQSSVPISGPVAQLGARFHGMEEVVGSIPTRSTIIQRVSVCARTTDIPGYQAESRPIRPMNSADCWRMCSKAIRLQFR